jgi:ABC-2 type transport system permease protein
MKDRMLTLIRREYWEHRALWIWPVAVAALVILAATVGRGQMGLEVPLSPQERRAAFELGEWWLVGFPLALTAIIVLWIYAADCLYAERRDRSILFWKSMPVSDTATVLSKLLVAMVITPLGVYLLTLLTSLIIVAVLGMRGCCGPADPVLWDGGAWLHAQSVALVGWIASTLWYAPITAYLMLVSAWARRNVSLWVLLPPVLAALVERIALGTHYVGTALLYRLGAAWRQLSVNTVLMGPSPQPPGTGSLHALPSQMVAQMRPAAAFANIDLWLGLLVAVACIYGAIRIRRYRDDT